MANAGRVLSIDITNESITVVEITASQKKQTTRFSYLRHLRTAMRTELSEILTE